MLYESEVIDAVCNYLEAQNYRIDKISSETERGDDIRAVKEGIDSTTLFVEAKGETSSKLQTNRFGEPFSRAQVRSHISKALYKASETITREDGSLKVKVGIALPRTNDHEEMIDRVQLAINRLGIGVFWVDKALEVVLEPDNWLNS